LGVASPFAGAAALLVIRKQEELGHAVFSTAMESFSQAFPFPSFPSRHIGRRRKITSCSSRSSPASAATPAATDVAMYVTGETSNCSGKEATGEDDEAEEEAAAAVGDAVERGKATSLFRGTLIFG
jgi:hypothetical protein